MKNARNIKWIVRIGLLLIALIVILAKPIYTMLTSQEQWSGLELADYKTLFKNDLQSKLILFNTIQSKTREPESQYVYNDDFNIFITKLHISDTLNLTKNITIKKQASIKAYNDLYFSIRSSGSKIHVKSGELPLTNDIEIGIENPNVKIIDSIPNRVSFYIVFKRLSLTINQNQNYLILESGEPNYPAAFTFIKKGNLLYVLLMTPANKNAKMQPSQLTNIIN
jgi:hypothetical protein